MDSRQRFSCLGGNEEVDPSQVAKLQSKRSQKRLQHAEEHARRQLAEGDEGFLPTTLQDSCYAPLQQQHQQQLSKQLSAQAHVLQHASSGKAMPATQRANATASRPQSCEFPPYMSTPTTQTPASSSPRLEQQRQQLEKQQQQQRQQELDEHQQLVIALNLSTMCEEDASACLAASLPPTSLTQSYPSQPSSSRDYSSSWLESTSLAPVTPTTPFTTGWSAVGKRANDASDWASTSMQASHAAPTTSAHPSQSYAYSPAGLVRLDLVQRGSSDSTSARSSAGQMQGIGSAAHALGAAVLPRALSGRSSKGGNIQAVEDDCPSYPALASTSGCTPFQNNSSGKKTPTTRKNSAKKGPASAIRVLHTSTLAALPPHLTSARLSSTHLQPTTSHSSSGTASGGVPACSSPFQRGSSLSSSGVRRGGGDSSVGSGSDCEFLPAISALDLEWDLRMSGFKPAQYDVLSDEILDAQDESLKSTVLQLLAGQGEGSGTGPDKTQFRGVSQDAMLAMMGTASARHALASGKDAFVTVEEATATAEIFYTSVIAARDFEAQVTALAKHGWERVTETKGAHFKNRRVLLDGSMQTLVHACSPSDSQRGVKNFQSQLRGLDKIAHEKNAAFCKQQGPQRRQQAVPSS